MQPETGYKLSKFRENPAKDRPLQGVYIRILKFGQFSVVQVVLQQDTHLTAYFPGHSW